MNKILTKLGIAVDVQKQQEKINKCYLGHFNNGFGVSRSFVSEKTKQLRKKIKNSRKRKIRKVYLPL